MSKDGTFSLLRLGVRNKRAIEKSVQARFANEAYRWPLLRAFDFEGYLWKSSHLIIILRDKLSGVPVSHGEPVILDDPKSPSDAPNLKNIETWHAYGQTKFKLRPQDAIMLIPIVPGGNSAESNFHSWSEGQKNLWRKQIHLNITRHLYLLKGFDLTSDFFTPPGYASLTDECGHFFKDHPDYDKNVLIMTRFEKGNRILEELDTKLRETLRRHSLNPLRADDKMYLRDRNLWNNVCVYMICCKYGIAILEDRAEDEFNPNVALEYGFMRALNKAVLLLADVGFRNLRADIIGTLREKFDITDIGRTISSPVETWLKELELGS